MFHRFEHVNLSCHDLDTSRNFYQTIFPDWFVRAEGETSVSRWMHFGDRQFYLALNHAPNAKPHHENYESIGVNHIGLVIENGDKMRALLDRAGIEYYTYDSAETKHRIYVIDPDGNEVELVEYQPDYALR